MSRSNPQSGAPNPATKWYEWDGANGTVRYYDRAAKANATVALPFTFILLDELGSVRGWHERSKSGIYSNEVRDTRQDVLVVKAKKGGTLAQGLYKDIKDRANAVGGRFTANCYIAIKNGGDKLAIASLQLKGGALNAWMEFRKEARAELVTKAVAIVGFHEGKKGQVTFRTPKFKITPLLEDTNAKAVALDVELQKYLDAYLQRNTRDRVEPPPADADRADDAQEPPPDDHYGPSPVSDEDIPWAWLMPLVLPALGLLGAMGGVA